jgi:hypothetical protein
MRDWAFDPAAIAADAVTLAVLPGGTGHEQVRIGWLQRRLAGLPGDRRPAGSVPPDHPLAEPLELAPSAAGLS